MPIARVAVLGLLTLAAVLVVVFLVRPFIFSFATPRDDANYPVVSVARADAGPVLLEVVLNDQHGLPGEVPDGEHARLMVVVAPDPRGRHSVVTAWSPTNDCAVQLADDRLVDCEGDAWIYSGVPIDPSHAPLTRFPTTERTGALIVDFTQPIGPDR